MKYFLNSIGWVLSIITAAGNGFVVFLVAKTYQLHCPANWFVLPLAVADFGVGIAVFPPGYFCIYSVACDFRVYMAFFSFFLHSSVTNLCVLTWNRYIVIVHPFRHSNSMSERRPGIIILVAWLIPFVISLSLLVGMYARSSDTALKVLRLTGVSGFDIICCTLLFCAVVRILVVARVHSHQVTAMELQVRSNRSVCIDESSEPPASRRRERHNTACFIIALILFFFGCYIVVNFLVLCIALSCQVSDKASQVVILLLVLNSAVNPLVYAFFKRDIKRQIKKLICRENRVLKQATTATATITSLRKRFDEKSSAL